LGQKRNAFAKFVVKNEPGCLPEQACPAADGSKDRLVEIWKLFIKLLFLYKDIHHDNILSVQNKFAYQLAQW